MGSHFGAVGLSADQDDFPAQTHSLMSAAQPVGSSPDGRIRVYRYLDPSGSYVTATVEDNRLTCMTPGIAPGLVVSGESGVLNAFDCPFERPLELHAELGGVELPLPITIDDLGVSEPRFVVGEPVSVEVSAMAERISIFADEAAYRASGTPMAVESLIPAGLFAVNQPEGVPHQVTSHVLLSGTVESAEIRRHELTDVRYATLSVQSLGGSWPVAVDIGDLGGGEPALPGVGAVVSATCWISGHLAGGWLEPRRS